MFADNLSKLMNDRGVSAYRLSKETGIAQSGISEYRAGKTIPGIEKLNILASYFGISVEELVGDAVPQASDSLTDREKSLLDAFRRLPPASQDALLALVKSYDVPPGGSGDRQQ